MEKCMATLMQVSLNQFGNDQQCGICLDKFQENEQDQNNFPYVHIDNNNNPVLGSSHVWHKRCIADWTQAHNNCPSCRANIKPFILDNQDLQRNTQDRRCRRLGILFTITGITTFNGYKFISEPSLFWGIGFSTSFSITAVFLAYVFFYDELNR
jgi:hypothetical protein